jgi:hypothetical protein
MSWLERNCYHVAAAFELEHPTSIYCGIVRMFDLSLSSSDLHATAGLFWSLPTTRGGRACSAPTFGI